MLVLVSDSDLHGVMTCGTYIFQHDAMVSQYSCVSCDDFDAPGALKALANISDLRQRCANTGHNHILNPPQEAVVLLAPHCKILEANLVQRHLEDVMAIAISDL